MFTFSKKKTQNQFEDVKESEISPKDIIISQPKVELKKNKIDINSTLDEVLQHFTTNKPKSLMNVQRGIESKENLLKEVERFLNQKKIETEQIEEIKEKFEKFIWGYHILEDLINDPDISDIKVLGENNIRIKKLGKRLTSNVKFSSNEELKRFISVVAIKNKTNISDINAIQKFTDKDSNEKFILRFNITTEYVNSVNNPYLHIRKIPKEKYSKEKLIELGLATKEEMDYLVNEVKNGNGVLFTGKGASGKTTLMNVLLDEIPHDNSGLVIQESEELFSKTHPDLMFQRVRLSKGEGKIEYTLKDLAINGLLTDLDYFIIGEIKGGEAMYFLNASYTGHKVMASVHGNSSTEAVNKLVDYMKYESDYSRVDLLKMVKSIGTVVFLKDFKIKEISKIKDFDERIQDLTYDMVFKDGKRIKIPSINQGKLDLQEDNLVNEIIKLKGEGMSISKIAEKLQCSIYKVNKALKKG